MRKEEVGVVLETDGSMAKVRASRHGDCKDCGACPGQDAIVVDAQNPIDAAKGQLVTFEIQQTNMLVAAFMVYIMPLLAIFVGALLGGLVAGGTGQTPLAFQIGGGVIFFVASLFGVRMYDRFVKANEKMQPIITKIL